MGIIQWPLITKLVITEISFKGTQGLFYSALSFPSFVFRLVVILVYQTQSVNKFCWWQYAREACAVKIPAE